MCPRQMEKAVAVELPQAVNYYVNDIFYTLQGEGVRAGTPAVFLRFQGCNLKCNIEAGPLSPGGFACDTEFNSGRAMGSQEVVDAVVAAAGTCRWVVMTGGEPGLQVDRRLVEMLHEAGFKLAIETNGTRPVDKLGLDWVTLSPKVAEHAVVVEKADEVKYVRAYGQGIPRPQAKADHHLISPAFHGGTLDQRTLDWCVRLCLENPKWRLSLQLHQLVGIK